MNILVGLVLADVVLVLVIAAVAATVFAMVRQAIRVGDSFAKRAQAAHGCLAARLGRKHLARRAQIPEDLMDVELFPEGDPEQVALQYYDPKIELVAPSAGVPYEGPALLDVLRDATSTSGSNAIDLGSIALTLVVPSRPPQADLLNVILHPEGYPV